MSGAEEEYEGEEGDTAINGNAVPETEPEGFPDGTEEELAPLGDEDTAAEGEEEKETEEEKEEVEEEEEETKEEVEEEEEEAKEEVEEEEKEAKEEVEEEEEEEEEKDPEMPLTEDMVGDCLSLLCKTGDGLAHAYVRFDAHEKELTDISILQSFIHLRYVDLSKNNLRDISTLSYLTHQLTIKVDFNKLQSAKLEELPFLQSANFSNNKLQTTEGCSHPLLEHLIMNFNEIPMISGLEPERLTRLHTLELRGNRLTTTAGINLPNLKNLFLAANQITKLEGLEKLGNLTTLHLRDNQLENLDGFTEELCSLQYINMRGNNVSSLKELNKLAMLPLIRAVVCSENPIADEGEYRLEVLIALRRLERLDKDEFTEEERQEAQDNYEQRKVDELGQQESEEIIQSDNEEAD